MKEFGRVGIDLAFGGNERDDELGSVDEGGFTELFEDEVAFSLVVTRTSG